MIAYLIMFGFSIVFCFFACKTENKVFQILFKILSCIPFVLVSGFRYGVGTDYLYRYAPDYLIIGEGADIANLEIITKLLMKFCNVFTSDYAIFFLITSLIINGFVFYTIYKYSHKPMLSIIVYFISSSFFLSLNLVRQYISSSILLLAFQMYLRENNKKKLIIYIILASLFHTASLVSIPLLFFKKKKNNDILLIIFSILIVVLGPKIITFILGLFSNIKLINIYKYSVYTKYSGNIPLSSLIVEIAIYLYYCYIYKKLKNNNCEITCETNFYINLQWFTVLLTIACSTNELFVRLASMFSFFQILSFAHFYFLSNINENREIHKIRKEGLYAIIIICLLMVGRLYYSTVLMGAMDVVPYKTIKERPKNIKQDINMTEYYFNRS